MLYPAGTGFDVEGLLWSGQDGLPGCFAGFKSYRQMIAGLRDLLGQEQLGAGSVSDTPATITQLYCIQCSLYR